jgi:ubiquinone/menaquinone biosynthesis C-methylase UbiE
LTANQPNYTVDEFERESRHIETMIGEAMALASGQKVLFCGFGPDGSQVRRAQDNGAIVTVIEHRDDQINRFASLGAKLLRGSTSVIPARDNTYDVAVSFHYLHEIDPFFHAQVIAELARVARRIAVVEPAPPGDPLGKRIALLYSQAKRELGQFEYYQPMEYWKKLLQSAKADVAQHVFAFAKVPPREYLTDTVELLIRTIEVEDAPKAFVEELRQIAKRSGSHLLPPPRFVLVGAALGELPVLHFSAREAAKRPAAVPGARAAAPTAPPSIPVAPSAAAPVERPITEDEGYEFPELQAPAPRPAVAPAAAAATPPQPMTAQNTSFAPVTASTPPQPKRGLTVQPKAPDDVLPAPFRHGREAPPAPAADDSPFGAPFAVPPAEAFGAPPAGIPPSSTWSWEPPDGEEDAGDAPFGLK